MKSVRWGMWRVLLAGWIAGSATVAAAPTAVFAQRTQSEGPALWVPLAHPRGGRSFVGGYQNSGAPVETQLMRMGLADGFTFVNGRTPGGLGYRLEVGAAVIGEFDTGVSSFDFLVADFIVGVPLTLSYREWSGRLRIYHQSSHLGDDILQRSDIAPSAEAFDFEAIEAFVGRSFGSIRPYVGGEARIRRTPGAQALGVGHFGIEIAPDTNAHPGVRLFGGFHSSWSGDRSTPAFALRSGLDWTRRSATGLARPLRLYFELLTGPAVAGQFIGQDRTTIGFAIEVGARPR